MNKLVATVLARVVLAVIFALLIAALKWEYFQWGVARIRFVNTFFYPAMIVFTVVLVLSALLHPVRELYKNRRLPFGQGFIDKSIEVLRMAFSERRVQFAFWGVLIAILIGFAWNTGLLQDKDFKFNQALIPWKGVEGRQDSPVGIFSYTSKDNSQMDYLRNCIRMVRDMKAVGAKVVIVPLPYLQSEEATKLMEEMHTTGIVVFAPLDARDHYLSKVRSGQMTIDMYSRKPFRYTFVHSIDPFPFSSFYPLWRDIHDVALEALRVYYGFTAGEKIRKDGSRLVLGDLRYPIASDGKIYMGRLVYPSVQMWPRASSGVRWIGQPEGETKFQYAFPTQMGKADIRTDLSHWKETFDGRIVIIQWLNLGGIGPDLSYRVSDTYARILDHLIRGETVTHSGLASLLVVFVSILGCALILYRSRLVSAVALLMLFSGGMLYGSAWLFQEKGILIDMPAVFAALIVSMAVFTVLRLGYEWRFGVSPSAIGRGI